MQRAEGTLPTLKGGVQARLEVLLLEMRVALIANDRRALKASEEAVTNLLFDLE